MTIFALEHSKAAYWADFALYATAVVVLATFLAMQGPRGHHPPIIAIALAGLGSWTAIEYALHRFVLHGLPPFSHWHALHHERPMALICAPTVLSGTLIFLPALLLGDLWSACALTLGVLVGYLAYTITHHATHHSHAGNAWLKRRKRWHALHHHDARPGHYGVTSAFWDHVLGSAGRRISMHR